MSHARSAVPTFAVADVVGTARWYADQLGFHIAGHVPETEPWVFASLMLGAAEIMLVRLEGYVRPAGEMERAASVWDAYVRMTGVGAFYEQLEKRDFVVSRLTKKAHGDWEFDVRDPNGYVLVFGGDEDLDRC